MIVKTEEGAVDLKVFRTLYTKAAANPHCAELIKGSELRSKIGRAKKITISDFAKEKDQDFAFFVFRQIAEFSIAEQITFSEIDMLSMGLHVESVLHEKNCKASIVIDSNCDGFRPIKEHYPGSNMWRDYVIPWVYVGCVTLYVASKMPSGFFSSIFGFEDDDTIGLSGAHHPCDDALL